MKVKKDVMELTIDNYKEVISDFVNVFSEDNVSLYMFGNIGHPGISDLDLIVVINDLKGVKNVKEKADRLRELNSYILVHDILIYPKDIFKNIHYLHSVQNINHLHGEKIEIKELNHEEIVSLQGINIVNFTSNALFWNLRLLKSKEVSLREYFLALQSSKHSLNYISYFIKMDDAVKAIVNKLEEIRIKYTDYSNKDLENFLITTTNALSEMFFIYSNKEFNKNFTFNSRNKASIIGRKLVLFRESRGNNSLPISFLLHGASYSKLGNGIYSDLHGKLYPFHDFEIKNNNYRKIVQKQLELVQPFDHLYSEYKIRPMVPLACFYSPPTLSFKKKVLKHINAILLAL